MVPLMFGGQRLHPLPEGALWWPTRKALLVADLHLEKASAYARSGVMLPPYDSLETLTALAALVTRYNPRELWCLGDSFHDADGTARLPLVARALLEKLCARLDWVWIIGNHDRTVVDVGGRVLAEVELDGVILRHQADPDGFTPEISGHFHPKLRLAMRGRRVSRRCFVLAPAKLILPAFGALTGGLDVCHPAIRRAVGRPAAAVVPTAERLLRFHLA